ncbi:MAG: hypothetical protein Q4G05_00660 [Clostridia bacterium]|nr:hypothetical protein [Clostridia bacterium]
MVERKQMEVFYNSCEEAKGIIRLDHLADTNTMIILFCGKQIFPEGFNSYGEPIFPEETVRHYKRIEALNERNKIDGTDYSLGFDVIYDEMEIKESRKVFDSASGIQKSLTSLEDFLKVLKLRDCFKKVYEKESLNEFVIFGKYVLTAYGEVYFIKTQVKLELNDVCTLDYYRGMVNSFVKDKCYTTTVCTIPKLGSRCPVCGKEFSINDLKKEERFWKINNKIAHNKCYKEFYRFLEINNITRIVDQVYYDKPKYELLPNGYCNEECCEHKPWFLFHTKDGDIRIGWRKRVISIEFQEGFKEFDLSIFNNEDVTKLWVGHSVNNNTPKGTIFNKGIFIIHAWSEEKAIEYLRKVNRYV